MVTNKLISQ